MDIDQFAHLESPIQRWDVRAKVVSLVVLIFVFASVKRTINLPVIAGASILLVLATRIPFPFVLKTLKAPLLFLALMTPVLALSSGGSPAVSFGPVKIYARGLITAGEIAVKALSIMLVFVALFGTARLHITMQALESLKIPPSLLAIFLFTYRYIFLYIDDLQKLLTAARLRGYTVRRGMKNIRNTVSILATLLVRSYEQSDRVYAAMQLRGFKGHYQTLGDFRLGAWDVAKSVVVLLLGACLIVLETA